ncbi:MAG: acyl-CoA dehydrogenase family protein [Sphingorhabdus sp.]
MLKNVRRDIREVEPVEFQWSEAERMHRAEVRAFIAEQLPADWSGHDKANVASYRRDAARFCGAMAEKGWLTESWPKEFGGCDASPWRSAIVGEELWPIGEPRGPQYMNVNWIGPAIMAFGTPEQKLYHLNRISAGDVFWCQGFSEPDAGSDLASLRTRARREGDHYIVNGTKVWTSHAGLADFCFLLVRTDPESRGSRGISCLIMPMDSPGLKVNEIDGIVGEQAFHELVMTDVAIPISNRVGEEHKGWEVVRRALQFERVGAAHYEDARRRINKLAEAAHAGGLLDDPEIQSAFGEAWALCEAARMLSYRVVSLRAQGQPPTADANLARIANAQALLSYAELARRIYGPDSLIADSPGDSRYALAVSVAAGTTEIQLDQVATRMLDLPRVK